MIYSKRFFWDKGPFLNYRIRWESYNNPYDDNRYWEREEAWYIGFQFDPRLYAFGQSLHPDKRFGKYYTILGVRMMYGHRKRSERIL